MRTPALPSPRHIAAGAGLALLAAGLTPLAASANPARTGLVINEVYGGGGNTGAVFTNDFIELHNPSTSAISVNGLSLQYRSATGTGAPGTSNVFSLPNKTIQPGGYFLVQAAPGATVTDKPLPVTPDAQTTGTNLNLSGTGGQVYLVNGTAPLDAGTGTISNANVVDFVGWGTTTTSYEGEVVAPATRNSAPATTNATSISRKTAGTPPVVQDTDSNAADFAAAATPSPTTTSVAGPLTVAEPGNKSGQADVPITPFTLTANGGTSPYTWSATGLPAGVTVAANGAVSGTPAAPGTYTVTATATDSATPTPATDDVTFTLTVTAAATLIPISAVQGTGAVSPLVGQKVITRGIVTATYPSGGFRGFYIQTPGSGAANIDLAAHTASDGVFVRQPSGSIDGFPGDYVEVTGNVTEFAGATQIEAAAADITPLVGENPAPVVTTTTASWPRAAAQKESLEGMRYRPTGDFTVTNTFSTNNFGEVGLAQGTKPLIQRTEVELPGPAASSATEADNLARSVVLDDGSSTNFLLTGNATDCAPRPTGCLLNGDVTPPYVSTTKPVRVGARATFTADVIFTEGGSPSAPTYRFQPLRTVVGPDNAGSPATFENTRTAAPDKSLINEVGTADLKIASFNVLNYFTTLGDANDDNTGDGGCTPFRDRDDDGNTVNGGCEQRGAWDPQDLQRQQSKIVSALNALDADVVGLMEIENSKQLGETPDEATNSLVAALNAEAGAGTWAANPSSTELPASGMDVITNAIIYKPASVDRIGESRALGTLSDAGEAFDNAREPIGQVFRSDAGGDPFLFVVNHFKSKGSAGPNPGDADTGDGQGASNGSRKLQATALRDWVAGVQTETGVQSVVMGGDYNSYAMEDPLRILYDAGFTNVEQHFDNDEFSYSFSGLSGSLDHILVNDAALKRSTGTDIWSINAGESLALEYSRWNYHATDFHAAGPYRSSDHDPVVLGFTKTAPTAPPVVADTGVTGAAASVVYGRAGTVTVKVAPATATGTVTVTKGATVLGSTTLASGQGTIALAARSLPVGTHTLALAYTGDAGHKPSTGSVTVVVSKADPTLGVKVTPKKVKVGKKATVKVTVSARGFTPTGKVSVKVAGKTYRASVKNGKAVITLKAFTKPGTYKAKVSYAGDATTDEARTRVTVRVKRR